MRTVCGFRGADGVMKRLKNLKVCIKYEVFYNVGTFALSLTLTRRCLPPRSVVYMEWTCMGHANSLHAYTLLVLNDDNNNSGSFGFLDKMNVVCLDAFPLILNLFMASLDGLDVVGVKQS